MFAKVTETNGVVHWINLNHVRELIVKTGRSGEPATTEIKIDNNWVEKSVRVVEAPEDILAQFKA